MEIQIPQHIYHEIRLFTRLLDQAIKIQQIPAPTFTEKERGFFVRDGFLEEGLEDVMIDEYGNVYGCFPGTGEAAPIIISAHLDTVFPAYTDLSIRKEAGKIYGPGIGDNSLGVASLFGLLWVLSYTWEKSSIKPGMAQRNQLPGDLWFVANVGEEGLGDLGGMRALVKRFGKDVLAYLVIEGMALGHIYHRALGVRRFRVTVRTQGGHSWADYGRPSAIHLLADLITSLTKMRIPSQPRSSINIGVISGGTSVNTIAAEAHCDLDLRSESSEILGDLTDEVSKFVAMYQGDGQEITIEPIGNRPAGEISADHPIIQLSQNILKGLGIQPNLTIGSTDANIPLSLGFPALCVGVSTGNNAHTVDEYIYTEPIIRGITQLVYLVEHIFQQADG